MPGNRDAHQLALRRAAEYVAAKSWTQAIAQYHKALAEFPDDEDTWAKTADALERIGRLDGAARAYTAIADLRLRKRDIEAAVDICVRAARLDPGSAEIQLRLARVYQYQGKTQLAVQAYLALARIHQRAGRFQEALEQLQAASRIDPQNRDILAAMEHLRSSQPAPAPTPAPRTRVLDTSMWDMAFESEEEDTARGSPVEIARGKALSALADSIFEEDRLATRVLLQLSRSEIDTLIGQAIDFQTSGRVQEAIGAYRRILDAGVDMPAAHFNLGLLLQETLNFDEAIQEFKRIVYEPEYR
ncbi:MAG TPA: tetratricopeptide repeat protein, partial [Anaerolineae bacterium]|nr:tetratricopeptide repeat protein [Anaerolineae bacterium]